MKFRLLGLPLPTVNITALRLKRPITLQRQTAVAGVHIRVG